MIQQVKGAVLVFLLAAGCAHAQRLTGRIEGLVVDQRGAVVPEAAVTATHEETGAVYSTATSGAGRFAIPNARLGEYTVTAEAQGFRRAVVTDVPVEVGGTASLMITLEVGGVDFSVTVTAETAQVLVNTVDAELSTAVDNRRVLELPLNGRNAVELAMQQAGVYFELAPDGQGDKLFVHGQRHRSISMTLDGVDTQDNFIKSSATMIGQPLLPMAAENVQEFRVVTGLASAEYSRGATHISAVTRSGSNEFHGAVFWFNRNDLFSANNFFNKSARPKVDTPPLNRNQFGGRIGGPILRDKTFFYIGYQQTREASGLPVNRLVYTSRARRGIFRYLDGLQNTPENVAANPGLARSVDLLECGSRVAAVLGRDCVDGRFNAADPAAVDPFIGGDVLGAMPLPNNFDIGDGLNTGGLRFNSKSLTIEHLPAIRLDHRLSERHSLYATLNYVDRNIEGDFINSRERVYPALHPLGSRVTHSRGYSAGLISTLSPTLTNELRFGYLGGENAFFLHQPFATPFTLDLNTITDPYAPFDGQDVRDNRTVHIRNTLGLTKGRHHLKAGMEWRERFVDRYDFDAVYPFGTIALGSGDNPPGFSTGDLNALAGAGAIHSTDSQTARDLTNNLVGAIGQVFQTYNAQSLTSGYVPFSPDTQVFKNHELDLFVADTWLLRPNLTVNAGLRWEYATVPYETRGLALAPEGGLAAVFGVSGSGGFFNPGTFDGVPCNSLASLPMPVTTANAAALITDCATKYVPATSTNGRPLWKDDWNNFGPVVSMAWDPFGDGKTSIRAGFRISYTHEAFSIVGQNLDDNEGLEARQACATPDGTCQANPTLLRNVLEGGPPLPPVPEFSVPSVRSILDSGTIDFRTYDRNLGTPYYSEWTFGLSREVFNHWALEARYVGNRGVGLQRVADYNEINIEALDPVTGQTFLDAFVKARQNLDCNRGAGFAGRGFDDTTGAPCIVANPLMAHLIAGEPGRLRDRPSLLTALERNETGQFVHRLTQVETSHPAPGQGRIRGGSFWGQVLAGRFPANFFMANPFVASARALINDGSSTYHALEVELRRRFVRGFSFQANYTYGKALADFDGDDNVLLNESRPSSVRNPSYSRQEFMPRHLFNTNWIHELPLGAGKPYLNAGNWATKLLGGWQIGGLLGWRSGRPLSITSGVGTFHRSALSGENTVNLAQNTAAGEIRELTGRRDIGGRVFWLDPCTSGFLGGSCTDPRATQGLFQLPAPGRLGQLGQTVVFGPHRFLFDFSLMKRAAIRESLSAELRWEVFNAFNNPNFATPDLDITSPNFGSITRTVSEPRVMQFALKLNF